MGIKAEVLKTLLGKSIVKYPKVKETFPRFRGTLTVEKDKCTGCGLCKMVCPSDAIKLGKKYKKIKVGKVVHSHLIHPIKSIDMGKCMRCGLCVDICPVKIISFTSEFELSEDDKEKFVRKFSSK